MKKIKVADRLSDEELKFRMLNSKDIQEHKRWQALYIANAKGLSAGGIAELIGVSVYTINKWEYNYKTIEQFEARTLS
jgi:DNA-binding transcriptional regulator YiaG